MMGVMWEYNHARPLTWEEYCYWTMNVLPFGWSIISAPTKPHKPERISIWRKLWTALIGVKDEMES